MGRFDVDPPRKSELVTISGWEEFGEIKVHQVSGVQGQELIDHIRACAKDAGDIPQGKDIEQHAKVLNICITISGEVPPMEWLIKVPFETLKYLVGVAMELNSLSPKSEEKLEKN
jgi:hypothetical protein